MPIVRVYLPLDLGLLESLRSSGELRSAGIAGHAAAPPSARPGRGNDEEEREYAAWSAAADDAVGRAESRRRVIASADVDAAVVRRPGDENGDDPAAGIDESPDSAEGGVPATAVEVDAAVALSRIASFHVDEEVGGDVADLLWYDVTELDDVIALVRD